MNVNPKVLNITRKYAPNLLQLCQKVGLTHQSLYQALRRGNGFTQKMKAKLLKLMSKDDINHIDEIIKASNIIYPSKEEKDLLISQAILSFLGKLDNPTMHDLKILVEAEAQLGYKFKSIQEIKPIYKRLKEKVQSQSA